MTEHVSDNEIEEFALGELPVARLAVFEAHVSTCERCAVRLARESRLELQLAEVHAAPAAPRRRISHRTGAALATVALAAAVLVLFVRREDDEPEIRPIPNVVCPDGPTQDACVRRAQRHGLYVQYPDWAGPPPFGDGAWEDGPSVAPFPVAHRPDR
jgi:Putative zinc-finger